MTGTYVNYSWVLAPCTQQPEVLSHQQLPSALSCPFAKQATGREREIRRVNVRGPKARNFVWSLPSPQFASCADVQPAARGPRPPLPPTHHPAAGSCSRVGRGPLHLNSGEKGGMGGWGFLKLLFISLVVT